jgi:NADH:ubiquinone oxidoreductase subunit C
MHYAITIKYIYKNIFFFFLFSENLFKNSIILFLPSFSIFYIILFFKYSYFFKNFILLDLGAYEIPSLSSNNDLLYKNIIYYIFKNTIDTYIFIFSILKDYSIISVEYLFRNAKWLEKESSDFFNIFFKNKKDRRSLFTIPLFYESPFRKKFPVVGFYEIFICFFTKKIKFKHISFKN